MNYTERSNNITLLKISDIDYKENLRLKIKMKIEDKDKDKDEDKDTD